MLPLVFVSLVDLRLVSGAQMSEKVLFIQPPINIRLNGTPNEYIQYHMRVGGVFDIRAGIMFDEVLCPESWPMVCSEFLRAAFRKKFKAIEALVQY